MAGTNLKIKKNLGFGKIHANYLDVDLFFGVYDPHVILPPVQGYLIQ